MDSAKPFSISKREVWKVYKRMRANHGAAGVDEQFLAEFAEDVENNLYILWNRMTSGSYFPPPVRRVEIPKDKGGVRKLGIPTIRDRVVQGALKLLLEPIFEADFQPGSYGYRPKRGARQATLAIREDLYNHAWGVVKIDFKSYSD